MLEPITTGGIAILVISSIGGWLKIIRDTKKQNGNGNNLKAIKDTVSETDRKVDDMKVDIGSIKTNIKNQKTNCKQITDNFKEQITDNRNKIFSMKGKGK